MINNNKGIFLGNNVTPMTVGLADARYEPLFGSSGWDIYISGGNLYIDNTTVDKDIIFRGNDGGVQTEAFRLVGASSLLKLSAGATINEFSTDTTMAGDSDTAVPTEKAVKTYIDAQIAVDRNLTKEPTGFVTPENVIVSYDSTTQKITLTGTVEAYFKGVAVSALVSGWVSEAHTNTVGHTYFLYYNGSAFLWTTDISPSFDNLLVAFINYTTSNKYGLRECHGFISHEVHECLHDSIGTFKESGATIDGYTLNSTTATERRPDISNTIILDEDLKTTVSGLTNHLYSLFNLTGTGTINYTIDNAEIVLLSGANPYYNLFSTPNWSNAVMPANSVASVWIYAIPVSADVTSQKYRYLFVQPQWYTQAQNSSAAAMNTALSIELLRSVSELNLSTLTSEFSEYVAIGRIIIKYVSADWSIFSMTNLTGTKLSQTQTPAGNITSLNIPDGEKISFGTGIDGQIYSSSDNLYIDQVTSDKDIIFGINDGGVTRTPLTIDGSDNKITLGAGASIQFANDAADKILLYSTTYKIGIASGIIYYIVAGAGSHRFQEGSNIICYIDNTGFRAQDTYKVQVGTGNDGQIYSSSDNVYIDNVTQDKDIIFRINDGGSQTEVFRLTGATSTLTVATTIQAAAYKSSDGTAGWTGTFPDNTGATVTVKNGLITGVA